MAKVLVIDDDVMILATLRAQLEAEEHTVQVAEHGVEGLKKFKAEPFDIVITDIHMPEMEGIGTIRVLRQISPDTPIIAMTGGSKTSPLSRHEPDYLRMANELGAAGVIQKPFTGRALTDLIRKHLGNTGQ